MLNIADIYVFSLCDSYYFDDLILNKNKLLGTTIEHTKQAEYVKEYN